MGTVTVDSVSYDVYGDLASAKEYVGGLLTAAASTWRALTDNEKSRTLVSARYFLDRQDWQGSKTDSAQTLAWPRTDVTDRDGNDVDSATVPTAITNAQFEMAVVLAGDASAYTATDAGSNVKRLEATPVSIEYFNPTSGPFATNKFPVQVADLIEQFLDGATGITRSYVHADATESDSQFSDCDRYTRTWPF